MKSKKVSFGLPWSKHLTIGIYMPSSKTERPSGPMPRPPMSITWAVLANRPTIAAVVERRGDDGQVVQMAGAEPGIVGDVVIAGAHGGGGEFLQEVADAFRPWS